MPSLISLKRRMGSVRSTRQITRAMELVSASKLRRAQDQAAASRAYREMAYEILAHFDAAQVLSRQPLFQKRQVRTKLYIVLTSNSGLAGAYNSNVLKQLLQFVRQDSASHMTPKIIAVGNKGAQFLRHIDGLELLAHYPFFGDHPQQADVQPLLHTIVTEYVAAHVDQVILLYTFNRSSIKQEVVSLPLLPAQFDVPDLPKSAALSLNFEPDAETVVHQVATRLIEIQLWQAVLESLASEHTMRMLAMKNATDNADDLLGDYQLTFNTIRQASITQAIAEISGGAEALREQGA